MYQEDVVVIGNGESRKGIDLSPLANLITTIGCNAVHRELATTHLICCDKRMVRESQKNPSSLQSVIYTRPQWSSQFENVKNIPDLPYHTNDRKDSLWHWSSGPIAILLAAKLEFKNIHLIGFDLWDSNGKVNNVYKGTSNYSNEDSRPVDPSYWKHQIGKLFDYYSNTNFILYNHDHWGMPSEWNGYKNISFKTLRNFKDFLHLS